MWNGLVSWGGVETGQKEFLKQNCPINRNTYDLRNKFTILFHLLFTLLTWEKKHPVVCYYYKINWDLKADKKNKYTKRTNFFHLTKLLNHKLLVVRSGRTEQRRRLRT